MESIFDWSQEKADRVWFGTGVEKGSFTFHYLRDRKTISIFSVYTNDNFVINYGWMVEVIGVEVMNEFHTRLSRIPTLRNLPSDYNKWPSLRPQNYLIKKRI